MKTTTIIIILVIVFIIFSTVVEKFALTSQLPANLTITLTKGSQSVDPVMGSSFTTDPSTLDPNSYYAVGNLNDTGIQAINAANSLVKNGGTTCNNFPNKLFIKLPATDAVCKTADLDLYDYPPDSREVCTTNINGTLYKEGKLKKDESAITVKDAYNGGKLCSETLPATRITRCTNVDAVCKTSDAELYDYAPDSDRACSILENGVWKKTGTRKLTESDITITPRYGTGRSCIQLIPGIKNIPCGPINAVCPLNDDRYYTFSTTAVKGSSVV